MEPNKISVVIVSFLRAEQLRRSLAALCPSAAAASPAPAAAASPSSAPAAAAPPALQIVVVDNGSRQALAGLDDEFPEVRFNRLPRNFGLTRALNIGIRASDGDYVLLMHDDVRISAASVLALAEFLEARPDVGAVCPKLNGPQVRPLPTASSPDPALAPAPDADEAVAECVSGAAIMVRAAFLRSMGHIDERYGNYGSDLEICARLRSAGRKLVVLGRVTAEHDASPSPMPAKHLEGDRAAGTAAYLGKHCGFLAGLLYRLKTSLVALATFRFTVLAARKIDGWG